MADLIGTASIRVDMGTAGAAGKIRRFANQAEGSFRGLQRRITQVQSQMQRLGPASIAIMLDDRTARGTDAIRARVRSLQSLGPVQITTAVDDRTAAGSASTATAVQALRALGPVQIPFVLDDQSGTGTASAHAAVTGLQALGPVRIPVTIGDDTSPGDAAIRATIARMQGLGPVRIPVSVNDSTRRGVRTVQAAVASLQRLGPIRIDATVDVDATATTAAAAALRDLQAAARTAARALGTLATRATAATAALALLATQARSLRGDVDDLDGAFRRAGGGMTGLRGRLGTVTTAAASTGSAIGGLRSAALLLAPALIPIAVQAVPIVASLGAATVAIGVFGLAAGGQIAALSEAAEAEKKYKDAVDEYGATSQQAAKAQTAFQRTVADMPHPTRVAATALSSLKDEYRQWSDSLAASTMPVATRSFALFGALFPKLTPVVEGAGAQLKRFVTIAAGGVQSAAFDRFMKSFAEFSTGVLSRANDGLIRFARTLDTGKVSGGVAQFMEYVRANGPLVRDTLSNLGQTLGNVLEGAANVGPSLLTVVNALAGIVAAVPPGAITVLLQLATAMKVAQLAGAGMAAASVRMAAFGTAVTAMRVAAAGASGVLPRLSAAMGTLGTMSAGAKFGVAAAGVGALVLALHALSDNKAPVAVDELSTSLNTLATTGKVTGALKSNLDEMSASIAMMSKEASDNKILKLTSDFGTWLGIATGPSVSDAAKNLDAWDKSMANAVSGGKPKLAAAQFEILKKAWVAGGGDVDRLNEKLNDYQGALANQKFEQQIAAEAMGLFGQQAQKTSAKLAEQKASADGLRQAIQALNDVNRAGLGGMIGFEASIDAAGKAARENAGSLNMVNGQLDLNSPKAQAAASALNDLASKTDEAASAARESGQSWSAVNGVYERGRAQLVKNAMQMGLTRSEAKQLADQILKTPDKTALLKADITDWKTKISDAEKQLKTAKGDKKAKLTADIAEWRAKVAAADLQLKGTKASKSAKLTANIADWKAKVAAASLQLRTAKGEKKAKLSANITDWKTKIAAAQRQINGLPASKSTTLSITKINTTIYRTKGSLHDVVGATGGLYTGTDFKFRGKGYAGGGLVNGPGTETSDSVYAPFLSKNEFVVNAKQTAKNLPLLKAINSGQAGLAGGGMAGAGAEAGAGLVSGMAAATRSVEQAARAMAAAVRTGVREELQISSPSKVMRALAKDVGKGFLVGLTGSRDKIKSVSKDLASDVRAAFSGRRETSLVKMIGRNTDRLLAAAKKRDAVAKKIADAKAFSADTASKAKATGSLSTIVSDDFYAPAYVEKQMRASLSKIKSFTANVQKLQKKGVNKALLRQILEMGPEAGGAFAKSLAGADPATIKRYNKLQADLDKQSKKLGNAGADMLYDSGKKAGAGFLTGLKAQQKAIEKLMLSIAKGMQKSIRRALGIKSPSTVFAAIGRNIGDGLVTGLAQSSPKIAAAVNKMAGAASGAAPKGAAAKARAQARRPVAGFGSAVGELQRLVDTGKWRKPGSQLFEDISFQGMSKNFRQQQMKVADGFWAAVTEIKKAVKSGKSVFEDMTFKGMSGNVNRFHDMIAQVWKGNPYGRNFGDWGNFGSYGRYGKYAGGGLVRGPGTGTSDSIPIWASRDEFMMRTAAVDYYGQGTMSALNSMQIPRTAMPSHAAGTARRGSMATGSSTVEEHYHFHNDGVIGSQLELDNWMTKSLDRLNRRRRLPAAAGAR